VSDEADDPVERFRAGQKWADVLLSLLPSWEAELLKRCSAVRWFDAELVAFLGSGPPGGDAAGLDEIIEHGFAEPVLGVAGRYRLRDSVRGEQFARWWTEEPGGGSVPAGLASLSERIARYYDNPAHPDPVEALYHDFLADADRALERFEVLYGEADRSFDLAGCQDLLNVFSERRPLLRPELAEVRNDYRRYLAARGAWIDDWYRTARYVEPALTRQPLEDLLDEQQPRVLQVWGAGGMGKSTLLRWLIARRCVPKPERMGCARVDFDSIDPFAATRQPWLVLLEVAAQLNKQLRDAPFHELLRQHGEHRERLRLRPGDIHAYAPAPYVAADELIAADVRGRFADALRELPAAERVLIVLDTLEDALVLDDPRREQGDLLALLHELAGVLERAPRVRLILSGRYDLAEELTGYSEAIRSGGSMQLTGFTDEEAHSYVSERRGLRRDLVESVMRAAAGVPFRLALIADAVEQRPDMTPAEVEEYRDADLLWLIERVVERVENGVRWLLRYGVVPRVLDLAFVRDEMRPHLLKAMSGTASSDDPQTDAVPARRRRQAVWRTNLLGPDDHLDVEDLWSRLKRYAGRSSWVVVDDSESEAVRFQPEVVNPMRGLLMQRQVYSDLQRDACTYFERRAHADPERGLRWMREAIYHRFQLEGPAAALYWRAQLASVRRTAGPEARRELALEVLGRDYTERGLPLTWRDGRRPLIAPDTLLEARHQLAWASAQLAHEAGLPATHPTWIEAEHALSDVEHLQRSRRRPVVAASRVALVQAPISIARQRHEEADRQVARALLGRIAPEDRVWLLVCHADGLSKRRPPAAIDRYRAALRLTRRRRLGSSGEARILRTLALCRGATGDIAGALASCDETPVSAGEDAAGELQLLRGELRLRAGDASGAAGAAEGIALQRPALAGRARLLQASAVISSLRPAPAVAALDVLLARLDAEAGSSARSPEHVRLLAEAFELRGAARAELMEAEPALSDLDAALELWNQAGLVDLACRCLLRAATFQLRVLGNLQGAAVPLDSAARLQHLVAGEVWTACVSVQAEFAARLGDAERARELVEAVLQALGRREWVSPREAVGAALTGLALGGDQLADRCLALLGDSLDRIRPPSARLAILERRSSSRRGGTARWDDGPTTSRRPSSSLASNHLASRRRAVRDREDDRQADPPSQAVRLAA
jgi:tetratricopeptide (TPR) repeat protein